MHYTLNTDLQNFLDTLEKHKMEITEFLNSETLTYKEVEQIIELYKSKSANFISENISPIPTDILEYLSNEYKWTNRDFILNRISLKHDRLQHEIDRLTGLSKVLGYTIKYLSLIIEPIEIKKPTSTTEKADFLLLQLNKLFGNDFYSISLIFSLYGVTLRENEAIEFAEDLSRREYVHQQERYGHNDYVKISVKGSRYIERKTKTNDRKSQSESINKKLDHIIDQLIILGYGDEIIFNEIEELRELHLKLSKKSWSQILKGKLIDLALSKLISSETVSYIYKHLTNDDLKLLS